MNQSRLLKDLSPLTKWKLLLLHYNVDSSKDLLQGIKNIDDYKVKFRRKKPLVKNRKVYDFSKDNAIIPSEAILIHGKNKTLVKLNYKKGSHLILKQDREGNLYIFDKLKKERAPIDIELVKKYQYSNLKIPKGRPSHEGAPLESFVQIIGLDRIGVLAFEGCIHWNNKCACLFCDSNPKRKGEKVFIPSLNSLNDFENNVDKWWDYHKLAYLDGIEYSFKKLVKTEFANLKPHKHFQLMSGNLPSPDKVWNICQEISETINNVYPLSKLDSYLNIAAPRGDIKSYITSAKKLGYQNIVFNLEVYGKRDFNRVCPGKSRCSGYENTINCLKESVKVFGKGKVRSNFVLGVQNTGKLLRGVKKLARIGIVSDYSVFIPKPCTPWQDKQSPDLKTVIRFTQGLVKVYKKYGFKGIYCNLSSRANIVHEMLNEM
jgi:hypothetical protein